MHFLCASKSTQSVSRVYVWHLSNEFIKCQLLLQFGIWNDAFLWKLSIWNNFRPFLDIPISTEFFQVQLYICNTFWNSKIDLDANENRFGLFKTPSTLQFISKRHRKRIWRYSNNDNFKWIEYDNNNELKCAKICANKWVELTSSNSHTSIFTLSTSRKISREFFFS